MGQEAVSMVHVTKELKVPNFEWMTIDGLNVLVSTFVQKVGTGL